MLSAQAFKISDDRVLVKVRGGSLPKGREAPPLHVIALVDNSGSMGDESKLVNVKRSLQCMLRLLRSKDMFSVVSFESSAKLHVKAKQLDPSGVAKCEELIEKITAEDGTNLSAGIITATDCMAATPDGYTIALFTLTDGEVNEGVRDKAALVRLLTAAKVRFPSLTTFTTGYGAHHNHELLVALAASCEGSYTFVNNLEDVASVFGDNLGGLLTLVAQNTELQCPGESQPRTRLRVTTDPDGSTKRVHIGDMPEEGEQQILISGASAVAGPLRLRYFDVVDSNLVTIDVPVEGAEDPVRQEATAMDIRIRAADMLAAGPGGTPADTVRGLIGDIEALEAPAPAWAAHVVQSLTALTAPARAEASSYGGPRRSGMYASNTSNNARTVAYAQQSAVLGMGRGLMTTTPMYDEEQEEGNPSTGDEDPHHVFQQQQQQQKYRAAGPAQPSTAPSLFARMRGAFGSAGAAPAGSGAGSAQAPRASDKSAPAAAAPSRAYSTQQQQYRGFSPAEAAPEEDDVYALSASSGASRKKSVNPSSSSMASIFSSKAQVASRSALVTMVSAPSVPAPSSSSSSSSSAPPPSSS